MIYKPNERVKFGQDDCELAGALFADVLGDAHGQRQPALQRGGQEDGAGGRGEWAVSQSLSRGHGSQAQIQVGYGVKCKPIW